MRSALSRGSKRTGRVRATSRLRELRKERGLTQGQLAERAGLHRNSIYYLEKGISREVSHEHATAIAAVLNVQPLDLGLTIRSPEVRAPRSVGFRRLTPAQRQLVDEMMSLSPEEFKVVREALELLRAKKRRGRKRR